MFLVFNIFPENSNNLINKLKIKCLKPYISLAVNAIWILYIVTYNTIILNYTFR